MNFYMWLRRTSDQNGNRKTIPSLSKEIGVPLSTLQKLVKGDAPRSLDIIAKIYEISEGNVTPLDLLEEAVSYRQKKKKNNESEEQNYE